MQSQESQKEWFYIIIYSNLLKLIFKFFNYKLNVSLC